jgi:hypothetical protein
VLKPGGRVSISDVLNIAPLPEDLRADPALLCGCVTGAISPERTEALLREAGFVDVAIAVNPESRETVASWAPGHGIEKMRGVDDRRGAQAAAHVTPSIEARRRVRRASPCAPAQRCQGIAVMSESTATAGRASARKPAMSVFERFLTFWVALRFIVGIALGQLLPGIFHVIGDATVAQVYLPFAVPVWLMIVPMLLKIDLAALREVAQHWRGIATTVGINWLTSRFRWRSWAGSSSRICSGPGFRPWLPTGQVGTAASSANRTIAKSR